MRGRAIEHLEGREPSPKLQTCPSAVRARLCAPPAETATARLSEQTATMVGEARSPSSPTERCRGRVVDASSTWRGEGLHLPSPSRPRAPMPMN